MNFLKTAMWMTGALIMGVAASFTLNALTPFYSASWPWSLGFLVLLFITLAVFYGRKKDHVERAPALIGGFVVRFLSGLVFLLVSALLLRHGFMSFALHFIAHWLLFTLAEIAYLSGPTSTSPARK